VCGEVVRRDAEQGRRAFEQLTTPAVQEGESRVPHSFKLKIESPNAEAASTKPPRVKPPNKRRGSSAEEEVIMLDRVESKLPGLVLVRADERWEGDLIFWIDTHLWKDYYMPRRQLRELLARPQSDVWALVFQGEMVGLAVVWGELRLHNLFLDSAWRGKGLGTVVVEALGIEEVRAKTNMSTGDPTRFYEKMGFETKQIEGKSGHIKVMRRTLTDPPEVVEEVSEDELKALKADAARWAAHRAASSARARAAASTRARYKEEGRGSKKVLPRASVRSGVEHVNGKKTTAEEGETIPFAEQM
jgi:GNAT superfamily N-acetyltransferase